MTQTNNERNAFELADKVINEAYPDFYNKGSGWWGEKRIPNHGILRGAIAKAIREAQSPISQNEQQEAVAEVVVNDSGQISIRNSDGSAFDVSNHIGEKFYLSPPKQAIPDGWKLVPIEPTHEMLDALKSALKNWKLDDDCYKAMINAAPTNTE